MKKKTEDTEGGEGLDLDRLTKAIEAAAGRRRDVSARQCDQAAAEALTAPGLAVNSRHIRDWVLGNRTPSHRHLARLARVSGCDLNFLYGAAPCRAPKEAA